MFENQTTTKRGYFDFSTIFKATKSYIDAYNTSHSELTKRINSNHRATAELIVRLYAKQLNLAIALGDDLSETLPGFKTFNPSLATCKGCTKRTIMNHKERLKAAGFITKEIHRGKAGIELWINPLIFAPKKLSTNPSDNSFPKSENTDDLEGKTKKLLPLLQEHQEQKNDNSNMDKLITTENYNRLKAFEVELNDTRTRQEQGMNTRKSTWTQSDKQTGGEKNRVNQAKNLSTTIVETDNSTRKSTAPDSNNHNKCINNTKNDELESAFLLECVKNFWQYAKNVLYKDSIFGPYEESEILNHIWVSVYKKFKIKGNQNDWTNYQELLYKRIDMVARYLERNPNRWVAPPHLYFDPNNTRNGFDKTYKWFLKQELLQKTIRNQILIQTTEKEWQDHDKGKGRHKHKTRLQLFRIQQQRLASYSDEQLMRSYEKSVQGQLLKSAV